MLNANLPVVKSFTLNKLPDTKKKGTISQSFLTAIFPCCGGWDKIELDVSGVPNN